MDPNGNDGNKSEDNPNENEETPTTLLKNFDKLEKLLNDETKKSQFLEDLFNSWKSLENEDQDHHIFEIFQRNDPIYKEINGFIVGETLGKGKFGQVIEFVDKNSMERFAAKIISSNELNRMDETETKEFVKNILIEVNLASKLHHNNIINIHRMFKLDYHFYLIMEYCFVVLSEYLISEDERKKKLKKLPKSQSQHYFKQLIDGLEYLHSNGIIHHDIKPHNLLIDNSHTLKIADFGSSTILDKFEETDIIEIKIVKGTPLYMGPECQQVTQQGIYRFSGTKCDIWSSGVTLFQMISGKIPFYDSEEGLFENIEQNRIKYPPEVMSDKQLLNLLQGIFVKDYNKRISLSAIKKHPWLLLKHTRNDFIIPPLKRMGDIYRGLTIMPYIHSKLNPLADIDNEKEVTKEESEESSDRTPNIRGNRVIKQRSVDKKREVKPLGRFIRLGF